MLLLLSLSIWHCLRVEIVVKCRVAPVTIASCGQYGNVHVIVCLNSVSEVAKLQPVTFHIHKWLFVYLNTLILLFKCFNNLHFNFLFWNKQYRKDLYWQGNFCVIQNFLTWWMSFVLTFRKNETITFFSCSSLLMSSW